MADIILPNIESLIDSWLQAEIDGDPFPVPFDLAWQIAGYSTKANAKAKGLNKLEKGVDFSPKGMKSSQGGRSIEVIGMTCDGFKHFCLMARTDQGRDTRNYFIEAEKKWKLVQKHHPEVAEDIETIRAKTQIELAEKQLELARVQQSLIAYKHGLMVSDPVTYQIVVDGVPMAQALPASGGTRIERITEDSQEGIGLTALMSEMGCFERTKSGQFKASDRATVKELLKDIGVDLQSGMGAIPVQYVSINYAIPPEKKVDAKTHLLNALRQFKPNLFAKGLERLIAEGKSNE